MARRRKYRRKRANYQLTVKRLPRKVCVSVKLARGRKIRRTKRKYAKRKYKKKGKGRCLKWSKKGAFGRRKCLKRTKTRKRRR